MKNGVKIILHIDLNAFYATCAIIKEPYLKHKVFVVGGPGNTTGRGVISTASYAARKYGIHSGMPTAEAQRIYPKLLIVPTDFSFYYQKSKVFLNLLESYTDLVLQASIDEAYVDITMLAQEKHPLDIAKEIQDKLLKEHQLPASIGIAPTLFLAKMASDLEKPLGITVMRKRDVSKKLYQLPISDVHGIGRKTYPRLIENGILKIGDLMDERNIAKIQTILSESSFQGYRDALLGKSGDIVDPYKYALPKSISGETTFNYDIVETTFILESCMQQLNRIHTRLKKYQMVCRTIGIKLKRADFKTINRSTTLFDYSDDLLVFKDQVEQLVLQHAQDEPIRLVGVSMSQLMLKEDYYRHFDLFTYQKFIEEK